MGVHVIKVPDIGEGIAQVELVAWHVKAGDMIAEDQALADVMTDKATVEIPSPVAGQVMQLGGEVGQVLAVGSELIRIEAASPAARAAQPEARAAPPPAVPATNAHAAPRSQAPAVAPQAVLHSQPPPAAPPRPVGTGTRERAPGSWASTWRRCPPRARPAASCAAIWKRMPGARAAAVRRRLRGQQRTRPARARSRSSVCDG